MHLIDLDVAVFDIFDLPPMNEYELYIKNFGRSDTKQVKQKFTLIHCKISQPRVLMSWINTQKVWILDSKSLKKPRFRIPKIWISEFIGQVPEFQRSEPNFTDFIFPPHFWES